MTMNIKTTAEFIIECNIFPKTKRNICILNLFYSKLQYLKLEI